MPSHTKSGKHAHDQTNRYSIKSSANSSKPSSSKSSAQSTKSPKTSSHSKPTAAKSSTPSSSKSAKSTKSSSPSVPKSTKSSTSRRASTIVPAKSTTSNAVKSSKPRPSSESFDPSPSALNRLPSATAHTVFHAVCAAPTYVSLMQSNRPYRSADHLFCTSRVSWNSLSDREWRAAFRAHISASRTPPDTDLMSSWIRRENTIVRQAEAELKRSIRDMEKQYESRHGFPFVCFLGTKRPEKVREELQERLGNATEVEMFEAANELVKIMEDRLRRAMLEASNM